MKPLETLAKVITDAPTPLAISFAEWPAVQAGVADLVKRVEALELLVARLVQNA